MGCFFLLGQKTFRKLLTSLIPNSIIHIRRFCIKPMKSIALFDGQKFEIFQHENHYWFHAQTVSDYLCFSNSARTIKNYCRDWHYCKLHFGNDGRPALYLSIAGVCRLAMKSTNPKALEFQDWVTDDLLPEVLTKGIYYDKERFNDDEKQLLENIISDRDNRILQLETKLTSSKQHNAQIFFNLVYQKQYYSEQITLKVFFEMVEIYLRNFDGKTFTFPLDRKKNILKAWGVVKGYKFIPKLIHEIDYKNDFREFMQCLANNYYTDGLGGTGEQNYLQKNIDNIA